MEKNTVSIVRYEKPFESVKKAVDLCGGMDHLPQKAKVFIKPNIVFWTKAVPFPKWGVITTSRVIEDIIVLLKDRGVDDITIGEGIIVFDPKDKETPAHAFKTLGYETLKKKYGVNYINIFDRDFEKVDLGDGIELNFNADILHSDFVVDLPAMKAHNQTIVSLGIKNLKGMIDINSRKKCHSPDPDKDLHFMISRMADKMPPMLTLIDGIYSLERGPAFDGKMHRSNVLIASKDVFSADKVGAKILGYEASQIPYLAHAASNRNRPTDLSDIEIKGEAIENIAAAKPYQYDFSYQEDENVCLPLPLARKGLKGVFYRKFDSTMCTYCAGLTGLLLTAIGFAWKGEPWDTVEVLSGKSMKPTPGMKKTILFGQCMYQAHKDNPDIQEMIPIKGCPPKPADALKALHQAGIDADPGLFEQVEHLPGFFMAKYQDKPEFDESFFRVEDENI
jgi:uncharacterized protein (DUF362 family)